MASTFTKNIGIEKIADGEQSSIWGQTTNNNFELIDRAVNGVGFVSVASTAITITTSSGVLTDGQFAALVFTGGAGAAATVTISPNTAQKTYLVRNATSNSLVFTQGSGSTVTIAAGGTAAIACTGSGPTSSVFDMTALMNTATSVNTPSTLVRRDATGAFAGSLTGNVTGNASTATKLAAARTIGGVAFDGTANINLPGVNVVGNQNTTGNAAGLTGLTASIAELNRLDGFTGTVADLNYAKDLRATGVTSTEFDHLDGVTSSIQTQLNGKQASLGFTPVQQGGGTSQGSNKVYIGWDGSGLRAQVDNTDLGRISFGVDVMGTIAAQGAGAIGTYAMMRDVSWNGGIRNPNDLVDGANLRYMGANGLEMGFDSFGNQTIMVPGGAANGTWRLMGYLQNDRGNYAHTSSVYLRVS